MEGSSVSPVVERQPAAQNFEIRPLSDVAGAEVVGLDLRRPLDAAARQAVYGAFVRHHVLAFRGQDLSKDEQVAFTEQFGTLERHVARNRGVGDHPLVHIVSNLNAEGEPSGKIASQKWHTDKSFRELPSLATILHARIMPPQGGDTCFANMILAYEALSDAEKAELDGVGVIHSWELSCLKAGRAAPPDEIADAPPMTHPLVRTSPNPARRACSWVSTPRTSTIVRLRPAAPGSRSSKRMRRRSASSTAITGSRATC